MPPMSVSELRIGRDSVRKLVYDRTMSYREKCHARRVGMSRSKIFCASSRRRYAYSNQSSRCTGRPPASRHRVIVALFSLVLFGEFNAIGNMMDGGLMIEGRFT